MEIQELSFIGLNLLEKFTIDNAVSLLEEKLKDKKDSKLRKTKISNKKTNKKTNS